MVTDRVLGEQHRTVLSHAQELERLTGDAGRGLPHAHARHLLTHHAKALHQTLVEHFAAEEEDGYFGSLRAEQPHLVPRIDGLQAQHAPTLEVFAILVKRIPHANLVTIKEEVRAAVATLREHEAGERALLQDAVLVDVGVGD